VVPEVLLTILDPAQPESSSLTTASISLTCCSAAGSPLTARSRPGQPSPWAPGGDDGSGRQESRTARCSLHTAPVNHERLPPMKRPS